MVSIGEIIYRLQENPLLRNIRKSDIANHIKTVINLIGAPGLYEDKSITLDIYDFRAQLPKDFVSRTAVRRIYDTNVKVGLMHNTDDFHNYSTLPTEEEKDGVDLLYTHKIIGDFIYTDFKEGKVEVMYTAITTDEQGMPMIVGNESVRLAIEWYIKQRYYEILWTTGSNGISERHYQNALTMYYQYIGQATNAINTPDPLEAEAIGNTIVRLIPHTDNVESAHKYDSQKERRRNNNNPYR